MEILNKINASGIQTLDLLSYKPKKNDFVIFDIVPFLLEDFLLQEKKFRLEMAKIDWIQFTGKDVIIIVPMMPLFQYGLIC